MAKGLYGEDYRNHSGEIVAHHDHDMIVEGHGVGQVFQVDSGGVAHMHMLFVPLEDEGKDSRRASSHVDNGTRDKTAIGG